MALPLYLALTAGEFQNCSPLPEHTAWMACHYSPYGLGLSNSPRQLPEGAMLILNDRIPISGHDPQRIADQLQQTLEQLSCDSLLLDFQRPDKAETAGLCRLLAQQLPFDLTGIDFAMTALFIVIATERALSREDRLPLMLGGVCAVSCLLLLGPDKFLAPALALTAVLLVALDAAGKGAAA